MHRVAYCFSSISINLIQLSFFQNITARWRFNSVPQRTTGLSTLPIYYRNIAIGTEIEILESRRRSRPGRCTTVFQRMVSEQVLAIVEGFVAVAVDARKLFVHPLYRSSLLHLHDTKVICDERYRHGSSVFVQYGTTFMELPSVGGGALLFSDLNQRGSGGSSSFLLTQHMHVKRRTREERWCGRIHLLRLPHSYAILFLNLSTTATTHKINGYITTISDLAVVHYYFITTRFFVQSNTPIESILQTATQFLKMDAQGSL